MVLGCTAAILTVGLSSTAHATHFRAGNLSWAEGSNPGLVEFNISFVARRSYYGSGTLRPGDTFSDPSLNFGDGASTTPNLTVVAIDDSDDVIFAEGFASHTYTANGPFNASLSSCCRLESPHINNPGQDYRITSLVDFVNAPQSPSTSITPLLSCPTSGQCAFTVPATPSGNAVRYRLATPAEAGASNFLQPGPPTAPNLATIGSTTGRYTWNTAGAQLNTGAPSFYSTQVVVELVDGNGNVLSNSASDFFLTLDDGALGRAPACNDSDGDGNSDDDGDSLCDNWETAGIDIDEDGVSDLTLPGSNPNRKDIYVEIDYMQGRKPGAGALADVEAAFARHNISLHTLIDDEVPFAEGLGFEYNECGQACPANSVDFDTLKDEWFGTSGERASATRDEHLEARRYAYHYGLWGNNAVKRNNAGAQQIKPGILGTAEISGNDFIVTLGDPRWHSQNTGSPTRRVQSGTYMHELGHNLGLRHGGADDIGCKPNYLSVMNYSRTVASPVGSAALDYSNAALPPLDEADLDERRGVQGPSGAEVAAGPGVAQIVSATGPIDWNRSNGDQETGVSANVNMVSRVHNGDVLTLCGDTDANGSPLPPQELTGHDDWSNLFFGFQASGDFADAVHPSLFFADEEPSAENYIGFDSDRDGVDDIQDVCPAAADSGQVDSDGDGIGDACGPKVDLPKVDLPIDTTDGRLEQQTDTGGLRAPETIKRRGPQGRIHRRSASFQFSSDSDNAQFGCSLDERAWELCSSPHQLQRLRRGRHVLRVVAVDAARGYDTSPAVWRFNVTRR